MQKPRTPTLPLQRGWARRCCDGRADLARPPRCQSSSPMSSAGLARRSSRPCRGRGPAQRQVPRLREAVDLALHLVVHAVPLLHDDERARPCRVPVGLRHLALEPALRDLHSRGHGSLRCRRLRRATISERMRACHPAAFVARVSPDSSLSRWRAPARSPRPARPLADVTASEHGFTPASLKIPAGGPGSHGTVTFVRTTDKTCATEVVFPDLNIEKKLPLNQVVPVDLPTDTAEDADVPVRDGDVQGRRRRHGEVTRAHALLEDRRAASRAPPSSMVSGGQT